MKMLAACFALLVAVSLTHGQTASSPAAPTPAKNAPTAKKEVKKQEVIKEPEPKIPGTIINRSNGKFLGLEVVNGQFKLTFYDEKKKPMVVDVTRATARWPNPRAPGDNRTVLNGTGTSLSGSKPVLPPFTFNVYLTLLKDENAVESYVVPFRG